MSILLPSSRNCSRPIMCLLPFAHFSTSCSLQWLAFIALPRMGIPILCFTECQTIPKNLLMGLFLMVCFPRSFQEGKRPIEALGEKGPLRLEVASTPDDGNVVAWVELLHGCKWCLKALSCCCLLRSDHTWCWGGKWGCDSWQLAEQLNAESWVLWLAWDSCRGVW